MTDAESDRKKIRETLRAAREYAAHKSFGDGRLREPEREKLRIKYVNAAANVARVERQLLNDRDIDQLADRMDDIEERRERARYR